MLKLLKNHKRLTFDSRILHVYEKVLLFRSTSKAFFESNNFKVLC